ncbi:Abi family protein [Pseudomonas sp. HR96]|uniref:Abi family protein n=1 Tax=Pseudomonas sp. HR96 TaxID=1027966 RepID=UPI002A74F5C6|nr:Abi family protein [Pseudomonas sp. HR96]WPP00446.1 Abi family protein [Pseudomonas sp. HR96]
MTIGQLSRLFSDLHLHHRKTVAAKFGYNESVLVTWLKSLTILRNVCAHHGRLWNASITADALKYAKAKQVLQVLAVFIVFGQMTRASRHSVLNSLFE